VVEQVWDPEVGRYTTPKTEAEFKAAYEPPAEKWGLVK